eukprot:2649215-Pyramimonas_sp.AAC.1
MGRGGRLRHLARLFASGVFFFRARLLAASFGGHLDALREGLHGRARGGDKAGVVQIGELVGGRFGSLGRVHQRHVVALVAQLHKLLMRALPKINQTVNKQSTISARTSPLHEPRAIESFASRQFESFWFLRAFTAGCPGS